ncbi:MAG: hypothetical protein AAF918_02425 [Pseudomonadota bacterium]
MSIRKADPRRVELSSRAFFASGVCCPIDWFRNLAMMLVLGFPVAGWSAEPRGELGLWLKQSVAPALVERVGSHPRFSGSTIELVALDGDQPTDTTNRLIAGMHDYLRHRLLEQSRARIAWQRSNDCERERPSVYLLGVGVRRLSGNRYQVRIGALDPEEGVWLPGTSFRWQGLLSTADRRLLRDRYRDGTAGSRTLPLPLDDAAAVSNAFVAQLRCSFPFGLEGTVDLVDDGARQGLEAQLLDDLIAAGLARGVEADREADWLLTLQSGPVTGTTRELALIAAAEGERGRQRLARVFVRDDGRSVEQSAGSFEQPALVPYADGPLLGAVTRGADERCDSRSRESCAVLDFKLNRSAYLFSFRTEGGTVEPSQCQPRASMAEDGRRRYRVPVSDERGPMTFYVVATRDPEAAEELARLLRGVGSYCSRSSQLPNRWLERLEAALSVDDSLSWRAIEINAAAPVAVADR